MSAFNTYWPMDDGPGANSGVVRWRKMARLWAHDGVVRGVGGELGLVNWDQGTQEATVQLGAVWVDGFYAENPHDVRLRVPSNVGLVVARLDPGAQRVSLAWKEGPSHGPTPDPDGLWEVPLWYLWGDWADDRRPFVQPGKGLAELPPHVPRRAVYATGPDTAVDVGIGGAIIGTFTDWVPGWVPGRAYRVTAGIGGVNTPGPGAAPEVVCEVDAYQWDAGPVLRTQRLFGPLTLVNDAVAAGWTSFTLTNAVNCSVQLFYRGGGGSPPPLRVPAHAAWLEVQDLGTA